MRRRRQLMASPFFVSAGGWMFNSLLPPKLKNWEWFCCLFCLRKGSGDLQNWPLLFRSYFVFQIEVTPAVVICIFRLLLLLYKEFHFWMYAKGLLILRSVISTATSPLINVKMLSHIIYASLLPSISSPFISLLHLPHFQGKEIEMAEKKSPHCAKHPIILLPRQSRRRRRPSPTWPRSLWWPFRSPLRRLRHFSPFAPRHICMERGRRPQKSSGLPVKKNQIKLYPLRQIIHLPFIRQLCQAFWLQ